MLVPVTVKLKGFAVLDVRPDTVTVLEPPAETELGLKVHVAPLPHDNAMAPWNVLGAAAEMVKVAVVEPMTRTLDRALEESENTGLPVPASVSDVAVFTAFEVMVRLPVTLPVEAGVKLTAMVQDWPTFNDAATVGKSVPQLLVSPKPFVVAMLVMVTA